MNSSEPSSCGTYQRPDNRDYAASRVGQDRPTIGVDQIADLFQFGQFRYELVR